MVLRNVLIFQHAIHGPLLAVWRGMNGNTTKGDSMRPTFTKSGSHYLPVIAHADGRKEVIYGPPLTNGITATKYAALEIRDRLRSPHTRRREGDTMTYDEALAIRKKWADGAIAEQLGFQAALHEETPQLMSDDPYIQQRYAQGFHDARAILLCAQLGG